MSKRGVTGRRTGEDRISCLPEHLLCQILSDLPTKDSVRTSVLSKRWKRVWLTVPLLDLDSLEFPRYNAFVSFMDRFLDFSKETCIHKLTLALMRNHGDPSYMTKWIRNAVMRKVEHLDIHCYWSLVEEVMPLRLYTCETLIHLKLQCVSLADFDYVSLPHLKIMHLENNFYSNGALLERLISACPVLQELTVVRTIEIETEIEYPVKVLRVRSQSLKSLILGLIDLDGEDRGDSKDDGDWEVVIDAPGLNYLSLRDDYSTSFEISNLSSPAKVDINVNFGVVIIPSENGSSKTSVVRKFLTMLSSVREMIISGTNLKELEEFKNNDLLILSSSVPKCLISSLEYVEMKTRIIGAEAEMKLVKYFLENSAVLKKFTLGLHCGRRNEESIIFMELLRFKRCSASCEVVVDLEETYPTMIHKFL